MDGPDHKPEGIDMRRLHNMVLPLLLAASFAIGWVAPGNSVAAKNVITKGPALVVPDTTELQALRREAEAGDPLAQFFLGGSYEFGLGVPQDYGQAVRWYRLAAEQGGAQAQLYLGVMYERGQGVPQDLVYAHKWYNLAGSQGDTAAQENRRDVEHRMTREQVAEAQRLAREWMREFEGRTEGQ